MRRTQEMPASPASKVPYVKKQIIASDLGSVNTNGNGDVIGQQEESKSNSNFIPSAANNDAPKFSFNLKPTPIELAESPQPHLNKK
jgi:hypothetical protein